MPKRFTAFIVVDVQSGLDDPQYGPRNNPDAEKRIAELLAVCRREQIPVIFSRYNSRRADSPLWRGEPGNAIKREVAPLPEEFVVEKSGNSVFKGDGLIAHLKSLGTTDLVFAGIATDACVSASVREARDLGYVVRIVEDACATFDRRTCDEKLFPAAVVHETELGILNAAGVGVYSTGETLKYLASGNP
jgi:nicotinamidase-related amidase